LHSSNSFSGQICSMFVRRVISVASDTLAIQSDQVYTIWVKPECDRLQSCCFQHPKLSIVIEGIYSLGLSPFGGGNTTYTF
jgi:hypothetical protein